MNRIVSPRSLQKVGSAVLTSVATIALSVLAIAPAHAAIARIDSFTAKKNFNTVSPYQRMSDKVDYSFHMEWTSSGTQGGFSVYVVKSDHTLVLPYDDVASGNWTGSPVDETGSAYHSPINGGLDTNEYELRISVTSINTYPSQTTYASKEANATPQ